MPTSTAPLTNLPAPLSPLIAREGEAAVLADLICRPVAAAALLTEAVSVVDIRPVDDHDAQTNGE